MLETHGRTEANFHDGKTRNTVAVADVDETEAGEAAERPRGKGSRTCTHTLRAARIAFRSDPESYNALGLGGERRLSLAEWLEQAGGIFRHRMTCSGDGANAKTYAPND